jgi:hypothetical protein
MPDPSPIDHAADLPLIRAAVQRLHNATVARVKGDGDAAQRAVQHAAYDGRPDDVLTLLGWPTGVRPVASLEPPVRMALRELWNVLTGRDRRFFPDAATTTAVDELVLFLDGILETLPGGDLDRQTPAPVPPLRRSQTITPVWDDTAAALSWRGEVIRTFHKHPARNQRDLVEAFHREGWAPIIPDPFRDPNRLRQTIRDLNNSLPEHTIRFAGDGTGEGARWEPVK